MTEPGDANRSDCHHDVSLCGKCGGLAITEWWRIGTVEAQTIGPVSLGPGEVFIAPATEPCDKPKAT